MFWWLKTVILGIACFIWSFTAQAQEVSREQIKGLDEQVQEIKSDVLAIAAELEQLEEKLLYPSNTEVAIFVSLAHGETFRLDSVEIKLDNQAVAYHLYTFKELEALKKGGVQRLYTGNIRTGEHDLKVSVMGKSKGGTDFQKEASFRVNKDVGPKIAEVCLAEKNITYKDR
jgi:hypothetical protein